jgi:hypothetical protein
MPMNVNEGMHNQGVPFFPVSTSLFRILMINFDAFSHQDNR